MPQWINWGDRNPQNKNISISSFGLNKLFSSWSDPEAGNTSTTCLSDGTLQSLEQIWSPLEVWSWSCLDTSALSMTRPLLAKTSTGRDGESKRFLSSNHHIEKTCTGSMLHSGVEKAVQSSDNYDAKIVWRHIHVQPRSHAPWPSSCPGVFTSTNKQQYNGSI